MAIESVDTSYNGIPMSERPLVSLTNGYELPPLDPTRERETVYSAAEMAMGKTNMWLDGIKPVLSKYMDEKLRPLVLKMDNLDMFRLVQVLQARHTFIVTEEILEEVSKDPNLPS